ncbi:hypothetical protein EYF80_043696 [Liparis tanakae]|uniref:Uncharacterized protein n=1 Tax=Liparis tanakae TaxID=230148 RepID=A0A4Z2FYM3_9TELE|nr:hypothetical protein EYF80_043696 [Liparis tanakae]
MTVTDRNTAGGRITKSEAGAGVHWQTSCRKSCSKAHKNTSRCASPAPRRHLPEVLPCRPIRSVTESCRPKKARSLRRVHAYALGDEEMFRSGAVEPGSDPFGSFLQS